MNTWAVLAEKSKKRRKVVRILKQLSMIAIIIIRVQIFFSNLKFYESLFFEVLKLRMLPQFSTAYYQTNQFLQKH